MDSAREFDDSWTDPEIAFDEFQHPKKRAFLVALARTGNVTRAAEAAGVDRSLPYKWRDGYEGGEPDPEFEEAWDDALEVAADMLEMEARRRAIHGTREPVYYQGERVDTKLVYSDTLLIFLLKAARPEKFVERSEVALTGKEGGPVQFYLPERDELPDD